jgi:hypothetical protein
MLKHIALIAAFAATLGLPSPAQQEPERPPQEPTLTPEEAVKMLQEIYGLMGQAEILLNDAARGEALATEKEVLAKIDELIKQMDQAAAKQKAILGKIGGLLEKSKGEQKGSIDKINELIRRAQACKGGGSSGQQPKEGQGQQPKQADGQPRSGQGGPAQKPYDPNRNDPANKFRSTADRFGNWGNLPPKMQEASRHSRRAIEDFPPEFQEFLKKYHEIIAGEDR